MTNRRTKSATNQIVFDSNWLKSHSLYFSYVQPSSGPENERVMSNRDQSIRLNRNVATEKTLVFFIHSSMPNTTHNRLQRQYIHLKVFLCKSNFFIISGQVHGAQINIIFVDAVVDLFFSLLFSSFQPTFHLHRNLIFSFFNFPNIFN